MTPVALAPVTVAPATPIESAVVVHRLTLRGISWGLYDQLLAAVADGQPRMTYDRGSLELEMLSETHEALRWIAGRFVEAYAEESGIDYYATGSTTWRRVEIEGGLEADESYYVQNYARVRGRDINLANDPPPDLAIEIDLSAPDVEKSSIYARLGVPEIWRWRDARLVVLSRQASGQYAPQAKSLCLPGFPLEELAAALSGFPQTDPARSVASFRRKIREKN